MQLSNGAAVAARVPATRIGVRGLGIGTSSGIYVGEGPPTEIPPNAPVRAPYLDELTGDVYRLEADMQWHPLTNVKGPKGDIGELTQQDVAMVAQEAREGVLADLELDALAEVPDFAATLNAALSPPLT